MNVLRRNRLLRDRRGSTAVEFAMILPILSTMMIGAMEMGRYFLESSSISSATERLARYAMITPNVTSTQLTAQFQSYLMGDPTNVSLAFSTEVDAVTGLTFQVVDVSVPHDLIIPFVNMGTLNIASRVRTPLPPV